MSSRMRRVVMGLRLRNYIEVIVRLLIGLTYTTAGFSKALEFNLFIDAIKRLDIVMATLAAPAAITIILVEIVLGFSLAVNVRRRLIASLLGIMTSLFSVVLVIAAVRKQAIECGCFGMLFQEEIGIAAIVRDIILAAGCFWLALVDSPGRLRAGAGR